MSCSICLEKIRSKGICCPHCQISSHKKCLLQSFQANKTLKCFNCPQYWNTVNLRIQMSSRNFKRNGDFYNIYSQIVWDKIEPSIPIYQELANTIQEFDNLSKEIDSMKQEVENLNQSIQYQGAFGNVSWENPWYQLTETQQEAVSRDLIVFWGKIQRKKSIQQKIKNTNIQLEIIKIKIENMNPLFSVLYPCPSQECRGYINASNGICGMNCGITVCLHCDEIKKDNHECNPEVLSTKELIQQTTKPCPNPNCRRPISKVEGCNQMYCTQCRTVFDFNSLEIERTNNIHNPLALRDLRNNGNIPRHVDDIPYGGIPKENIWRSLWDIIYRGLLLPDMEIDRNNEPFHYEMMKNFLDSILHLPKENRKRNREEEEVIALTRKKIILSIVSTTTQIQEMRKKLFQFNENVNIEPFAVRYLKKQLSKEDLLEWYIKKEDMYAKLKEDYDIASNVVSQVAKLVSNDVKHLNRSKPEDILNWFNQFENIRQRANQEWYNNAHIFGTSSICRIQVGWSYFTSAQF